MSEPKNPYWREESRIYQLELEIAKTDNLEKKTELRALLDKEKTKLNNRLKAEREEKRRLFAEEKKRQNRTIIFGVTGSIAIIILLFFLLGRFFYSNDEGSKNSTAETTMTTTTSSDKTSQSGIDTTSLEQDEVIDWVYYHMKQASESTKDQDDYQFTSATNSKGEVETTVSLDGSASDTYVIDAEGKLYYLASNQRILVASEWDVPSNLERSSSEGESETESSANAANYPYAVSFEGAKTFTFSGTNTPASIVLNEADNSATFTAADGSQSQYTCAVQETPTTEITVFSAGESSTRTVKVNTIIVLGDAVSGSDTHSGENLYLFYNSNNGVSLATPNYAGNVSADQADVLLEALS
ncbi:MAG: hypothetical protein ACK5NA_08940 [Enterococcus sp.]